MRLPLVRPQLLLALHALSSILGSSIGLAAADPFAITPFPAVIATAEAQKIPLHGIALAAPGSESQPGDIVVALVSLSEKDQERQWIVQLAAVPFSSDEQREYDKVKDKLVLNLYTSFGTEVRLGAALQVIEARTIGPFFPEGFRRTTKSAVSGDRRARALIGTGFLGLGLDRYATSLLKLKHLTDDPPAKPGTTKPSWKVAQTPFPAEIVAQNRPLASQNGFEPEDERSLLGGIAALGAFFDAVRQTPGLQDILSELPDKGSLAWSLITHGGQLKPNFIPDIASIAPVDSSSWSADLPPAYHCPLALTANDKPMLACDLIVTAPRPPLRNCGGIIGASVSPTGDRSKRLVIRVLAAGRPDPMVAR